VPLTAVGEYDPEQVPTVADRAVVVGGSVAGLLAARVLADAVAEVVVLERDPLPADPVGRRGVPQSDHVHVLLEAGRHTLEALFPGFGDDVTAAGGELIDANESLDYYEQGDFITEGDAALPMYCASRPLFERVIRDRVRVRDDVTLRPECHCTGVELDDASRVRGVTVRDEDGDTERIDAPIVVDATGRTSKTPAWLEDHGFERPPTDEVQVDLGYASVRVDRPTGVQQGYLVAPTAPSVRGGTAVPIEDDAWFVTLFGLHGDHPPATVEGLREFAATLPTGELHEILADHAIRSEAVATYRFPASVRRLYDRLGRVPEGLLVTGDALASFNPIYGQGMSVAALDARALHDALADGGRDGLAERFFDRAGSIVDTVWRVTVGSDFQFPATEGPRPLGTRLTNRYVDRLIRTAHTDSHVSEVFSRVLRLEFHPTRLFYPDVAWRVLVPPHQR
jgi:2-polyprenyl-6-methoxyphenol hydroxylase-like FAD-dependent oxidoreductase